MWQSKDLVDADIELFKSNLRKSGIANDSIIVHMPYIGSLSAPAGEIYEKSINSLQVN
jgi:endonuclease IV